MRILEEGYKTIYDIVMKTYDLNPSTCKTATNAMLVGVEMALEKVGIIEKED